MQLPKTKDMTQEMEGIKVLTFADILRALREHPDWLGELRKLILTEELLELPRKFEELLKRVDRIEKRVEKIEEDVAVLKQDVAVLKQDVAVLKQDVAVLKQDVAVLKQDMSYWKGEFGRLKGRDLERTIRERYYAYFGKVLKGAKVISMEGLIPTIETYEDKGEITEEQKDGVLNLDLIVSGHSKSLKKDVILAVEVSYSLYEEDIERACERADVLSRVLQREVIPTVVACQIKEGTERLADERGVLLIKVDY